MPSKIKDLLLALLLCMPTVALAAKSAPPQRVTVFVDSQDDFSGYVIAAFQKKGTPASVVTDKTRAQYVLESTPVSNHEESGMSKLGRCAFAFCAGIADTSTVAVKLINTHTTAIDWSYTVHKQRGGGYNQQSMAEAIAKHLKNYLEGKGE